jgi:16S rRNA (cytidine1402-2'-O)-methyltransferase
MSILYIVATPIGNLGDITFRAVETLKNADIVACEDTRETRKLLTHFGIQTTIVSCRQANETVAAQKIIALLDSGKTAAYASDAGTPAVSDPGAVLARLAAEAGHEVVPIPGASAFAALVSVSGGRDKAVTFEGFLSPKPGRRRARLAELLGRNEAFVVYESPYRILKLLADLAEFDRERYLCIGREMTKLHEEYLRGSADELLERLKSRETGDAQALRGEFAVFVSSKTVKDSGKNADN